MRWRLLIVISVGCLVCALVAVVWGKRNRAATAALRKPSVQPSAALQASDIAKAAPAAPTSYLIAEKDPLTQADPDLTRRLIDTLKIDNPAETVAILLDIKKDATTRNEAANLLRRSGFSGLTDGLIKSLADPSEGPLWRSFCIQHLWMNTEGASDEERTRITEVLSRSIADRHTRVRRESLLALCRLHEPQGQETAIKWLTAKEGEGARDLTIRCIEDLNLRDQAPAVRKLISDPDESTSVQAIGTLGRWSDEASRPLFEEALKSKSQRIQNAAKAALRRLDGAKAP